MQKCRSTEIHWGCSIKTGYYIVYNLKEVINNILHGFYIFQLDNSISLDINVFKLELFIGQTGEKKKRGERKSGQKNAERKARQSGKNHENNLMLLSM